MPRTCSSGVRQLVGLFEFSFSTFQVVCAEEQQSFPHVVVGIFGVSKYEMAANYDKNATEAYVKYANLFTMVNPDLIALSREVRWILFKKRSGVVITFLIVVAVEEEK